ncbi:MAG: sporulation transcriptional regulator SpoIIID [Bacilli bacterium]|nr:sporulation transcriptional regulator SpoIIID [Bacilli bacterium]
MNQIKTRVLLEADLILKTKKTIREIASMVKVSKSTVHNDLSVKLLKIDKKIYDEVKEILDYHKAIRHINGGNATKLKYQVLKSNNS